MSFLNHTLMLMLIFFSYSVPAKQIIYYGPLYKCAGWNELKKSLEEEEDKTFSGVLNSSSFSWLAGYMSAFNVMTQQNDLSKLEVKTVYDYAFVYCEKNRDDHIYDVIHDLINKIN